MPAILPNTHPAGQRMSAMPDELLARQAAHGGERAFAALYQRYHQPLYRYCRALLRNEADAQDALQSTFAAALAALRRNQRRAPVRPWLFRIAHNESITLLRRARRDSELPAAPAPPPSLSPDEQLEARARLDLLLADIGALPDRARSALLLRELSGLSHAEIAHTLQSTEAAAKQAVLEARQGLAEMAEGRAMECELVRQRISEGDGRVLRGRRLRAHLRQCRACADFAAAIPARRAELNALVPTLAPAAASTLLARVLHGLSGHGAGGGSASTALGAGAGVVGKSALSAAAVKLGAGALVVLAAAGAVSVASRELRGSPHRPAAATVTNRAARRVEVTRAAGGRTEGPLGAAGAPAGSRSSRAAGHRVGEGAGTSARDASRSSHAGHGASRSPSVAGGALGASHGASAASHGASGTGHGASGTGHGASGAGHGASGARRGASRSTGRSSRSSASRHRNGQTAPSSTQSHTGLGHGSPQSADGAGNTTGSSQGKSGSKESSAVRAASSARSDG